ncbi:hypothetical protein WJ978_26875 [Achromobacter xylosoxidans]
MKAINSPSSANTELDGRRSRAALLVAAPAEPPADIHGQQQQQEERQRQEKQNQGIVHAVTCA